MNNEVNFYLDKLIDISSEKLKSKLPLILKDSFYARAFTKEQTLLVQKRENISGMYSNQLYAYSLDNGNFKFKVSIPTGYFLVYCLEVGPSRDMGMVCKPLDNDNHYAIEYTIEKQTGHLTKIRERLCTENINQANSIDNTCKNCIYPITNLITNKNSNEVNWKYNSIQKNICFSENIVYAVYHDFEEIILVLTSDQKGDRDVYLYNLDGSIRLKLELPNGFKISHCPTQNIQHNRTALLVICYNPDISMYNELKYMLVPDNGDLIYLGYQR